MPSVVVLRDDNVGDSLLGDLDIIDPSLGYDVSRLAACSFDSPIHSLVDTVDSLASVVVLRDDDVADLSDQSTLDPSAANSLRVPSSIFSRK